jgi:hypothetical protein
VFGGLDVGEEIKQLNGSMVVAAAGTVETGLECSNLMDTYLDTIAPTLLGRYLEHQMHRCLFG